MPTPKNATRKIILAPAIKTKPAETMTLFDTETTGLVGALALPLAKQPYIIELCAIKLDAKSLVEVETFDELINSPGRPPISGEVFKITGITEEMLKGKLPFAAHLPRIVDMWWGSRLSIAHNADFDNSMLELDLRRLGRLTQFPWAPNRLCTVEATVFIKGHRLKLGDAVEHCTGSKLIGAHRAINDVRGMADVVRWLRKKGKL